MQNREGYERLILKGERHLSIWSTSFSVASSFLPVALQQSSSLVIGIQDCGVASGEAFEDEFLRLFLHHFFSSSIFLDVFCGGSSLLHLRFWISVSSGLLLSFTRCVSSSSLCCACQSLESCLPCLCVALLLGFIYLDLALPLWVVSDLCRCFTYSPLDASLLLSASRDGSVRFEVSWGHGQTYLVSLSLPLSSPIVIGAW